MGTIVLALLALLLTVGCNDPLSVSDDAERDLDNPLPEVATIAADADYNTTPEWFWRGDGTIEPIVFRYRLNGGEWVILLDPEADASGVYSWVHGQEDDEGTFVPRHLFPGSYLFEIQQRNSAGNWSRECSHERTILVQPPVLPAELNPPAISDNKTPFFTWHAGPVQYGETGLFSWSLKQQVGSQWIVLNTATDSSALNYQVGPENPLEEGRYRFCVSTLNEGGVRSSDTCHGFEVVTFLVGGRGQAGGWIFYENPDWESDGWRWLEAAPYGWYDGNEDPMTRWGPEGGAWETGATASVIGSGHTNTDMIVAMLQDYWEGDYAANLCVQSDYGGFSDWFLPSRDELNLMYQVLHQNGIGGFSGGGSELWESYYWTSTESDVWSAWRQIFANGTQFDQYKADPEPRVRPVRQF